MQMRMNTTPTQTAAPACQKTRSSTTHSGNAVALRRQQKDPTLLKFLTIAPYTTPPADEDDYNPYADSSAGKPEDKDLRNTQRLLRISHVLCNSEFLR